MVSRGQQTVVMGSDSCLRPSLLLRFSHVCTRGSGEGITPTQSPAFPLCSAVTPFHCCFHPLHLFISLLSLFWCNFQISPHLCVIFFSSCPRLLLQLGQEVKRCPPLFCQSDQQVSLRTDTHQSVPVGSLIAWQQATARNTKPSLLAFPAQHTHHLWQIAEFP